MENIRLNSYDFEQACRNFEESIEHLDRLIRNLSLDYQIQQLQLITDSFGLSIERFVKGVKLLGTIQGMVAENQQRANQGHSVAYGEEAFDKVIGDSEL